MKIKTKEWGLFYQNSKGEWKGPLLGELHTKKFLKEEYGSVKDAMKGYRKQSHRRLKLKRMVWV